jgi:hypothetical protein
VLDVHYLYAREAGGKRIAIFQQRGMEFLIRGKLAGQLRVGVVGHLVLRGSRMEKKQKYRESGS